MPDQRAIAETFSRHGFAETYDQIADDVVWALPGAPTIRGKAALVQACEGTLADLAGTSTEFLRFLSVADADAVAIDVIARYVGSDGSVSVVSSGDFYEFRDGLVVAITSYAVELPST